MSIDKRTMEELLEKYIEAGRQQAQQANDYDRWELKRWREVCDRLNEELNTYADFHLWLKFTHPDILDQYRCIKEIKEKANG